MSKTPTSFKDLGVEELRRSAVEDFAVEVGKKDGKDAVIAALFESGVTWEDYVAQHPEVAPAPEAPEDAAPAAVDEPNVVIRTAEVVQPVAVEKYLVKMTRENPLFEIGRYRFTREHPYVLVDGDDLEAILMEDGFRQAMPSEVSEYYA